MKGNIRIRFNFKNEASRKVILDRLASDCSQLLYVNSVTLKSIQSFNIQAEALVQASLMLFLV